LSLAGHPDPERWAAQFSGSERTVAEYLLAEVLDRQDQRVRRLLLRTSILERVNGDLADVLTGGSGGERVLQDLEQANAFVMSLDATRTWFRYHQMFAGLLALELRRTAPGEVAGLHRAACAWLTAHGYPAEAIRHAQAAHDWDAAVRLLADHWPGLYLDGQAETIRELLAGFPPGIRAADAELAAVAAADELAHGTLDEADRYLHRAEQDAASLPDSRRGQARLMCGIIRLLLTRQRGNLPAMAREAQRLQDLAGTADPAPEHFGEDLRALALISLGVADVRGLLELARGRYADALTALRAAEPSAGRLVAPHYLLGPVRALRAQALMRLGENEHARRFMAEFADQDRESGEMRVAAAALWLADGDPRAAAGALVPVIDGAAPVTGLFQSSWRAQAFLLEALARDALGDEAAADAALERALDLAEPRGVLAPFLLHPAPGLLERHAGHRTAHAALIADIQSLLAGNASAPPPAGRQPLREP
jgi:LuxR family maltose regulon positive regulatory protein